MRIADRSGGTTRIFVGLGALALATAGLALTCTPPPTSWRCGTTAPLAADLVEVHFKLAPDAVLANADAADAPLLMPLVSDRWHAQWLSRAQLAALAADPAIQEAFAAPEITLPQATAPDDGDGDACPITTPSFESYQGYLGPAPFGIDAPAAWRRGIRGQGIQFADIEGGWNAQHEDLPGDRITHVVGKPIIDAGWRAHGTAVLGEVVGKANALGVVGIAPDVDRIYTASIGGTPTARALSEAANRLRAGDVLLIELQGTGPRGRYLPMEYWDDNFEAIKAATDRGIVVIEAAGNGAESLDHKAYGGKFDRARRDSGAILIGAGGPPRAGFTDRAPLDFTNYGARVDVQGWGRKVATLDYGDLQDCDDDRTTNRHRHYTDNFSGTSSASPIVAGAAVLLESASRAQRGRPIAPRELRALLANTGTPQTGDASRHIGPRPDLARALARLP